jgi:hypothetical protein
MLHHDAMHNHDVSEDNGRYDEVFLVDTVEARGSRPLAPTIKSLTAQGIVKT